MSWVGIFYPSNFIPTGNHKAHEPKSWLGTSINKASQIWITLVNYCFSQKFKLLENCEFNHLTILLILPLTCGPKPLPKKEGLTCGVFNILN